MTRRQFFLARASMLGACVLAIAGNAAAQMTGDFAELSLEELIQVEISSLGRKNSTVFDTPAPAYLVTHDEIHRSGALSLPEVLRLVPGVQVARSDAANYAITIRGFNDFTSNKLLVLKDGRSVYNQLLSGTNWTFQETMLADVSRVEVQRGPAGTLWGANAVNGVVNLVTKNAHSTLGSLLSVAYGDQFDAVVEARHGFNLNPATAMRVYAKYQNQGGYRTGDGAGSAGWTSKLAGSRLDWDRPGGGGLTVIAEHREVILDSIITVPVLTPPYGELRPDSQRTRGSDLSLKWNQPLFSDGHLFVQASVEHGDTDQLANGERHTTADFDGQLTLHPRSGHEVITGLTFRSTADKLRASEWYRYADPAATTTFVGAFLQDEIQLAPKKLTLTVGSKFERNSYSGWETQPSVRLLWHPTPSQAVWAAVSRAARTPSRTERNIEWYAAVLPPLPPVNPLPGKVLAVGDPHFSSEHVTTFEAGHRWQAGHAFSVDTSLFYSEYRDLRGLQTTIIPPNFTDFPLHYVTVATAINNLEGHTHGGEVSLRWQPARTVRLDASVALVRTRVREMTPSAIPDLTISGLEGNTPDEEYKFHAGWDPSPAWSLDLYGRHTGRLAESGVKPYTGADLRLAYRPRKEWEIEVIGRDLLDPQHPEISGFFIGNVVREISRSVYLRVTYKH